MRGREGSASHGRKQAEKLGAVEFVFLAGLGCGRTEQRAEQAAEARIVSTQKPGKQAAAGRLILCLLGLLGADKHAHEIGEIKAVAQIHFGSGRNRIGRGGKSAHQSRGDSGQGGTDIALAHTGLQGKLIGDVFGLAAKDVVDDLAAVFGIGFVNLVREGLLIGVL